ncbi:TIGR00282 family metallophosphoesterase [endosymbiont GvMRE of Glomus versiforme]|uniref:TIGR00282 family metallophosphoesterase n=1 Tax=endosymbiont GvMRE of Glomus versiforme TaxID=2039283 RepID=UPI000EC578F3|nr:TIGR00282 family metallophosphoesterase [endosymbiont GvMRE of Glomus versiforme]RHZ37298.1 Metallophosphoesterase [endosymbiont GvMRE of Glomus versiforme]
MKILAIGDIFGKLGRKIVKDYLSQHKQEFDLVIANVENATHGKGISDKHYQELKKTGITIMTSGNHIFHLEETTELLNSVSDLLRPLNLKPYHPGRGSVLINVETKDKRVKKVRITNLLGTNFIALGAQNPYFALEKMIKLQDCDLHLVDFHAETTAEKNALAWHYDGQITALWGTHTHVQTADERILPKGTFFLSDVGMTGPNEGIIGAEPEGIIQRSKHKIFSPMRPCEKGQTQFNGLVLEVDDNSNKVINFQRINFKNVSLS